MVFTLNNQTLRCYKQLGSVYCWVGLYRWLLYLLLAFPNIGGTILFLGGIKQHHQKIGFIARHVLEHHPILLIKPLGFLPLFTVEGGYPQFLLVEFPDRHESQGPVLRPSSPSTPPGPSSMPRFWRERCGEPVRNMKV